MPSVRELWSYGETGYHSLAAAIVRERYGREAMQSAFRILGEGQLSLTKFLLVTDQPVDLRDFRAVLPHVLARADFRTDLYVFASLSMDTLDYAGPRSTRAARACCSARRAGARAACAFTGELPPPFVRAASFCAGCLVVQGPPFAQRPRRRSALANCLRSRDWPLVVLVDDGKRATRVDVNFLWTTFTRFEPAADMHAREASCAASRATRRRS
jgi:hypothetical protein